MLGDAGTVKLAGEKSGECMAALDFIINLKYIPSDLVNQIDTTRKNLEEFTVKADRIYTEMSSSATEDLAVKAKELKESMDVTATVLKKYSETFETVLKDELSTISRKTKPRIT